METVIAIFVLLSAFVVLLSLFLRSTDSLVHAERKVMSVAFGETVLDDIKVWAKDYSNYSGDWSTWQNFTLPEFPGFVAKAIVSTPQVANPCSHLELGKPAASRLLMTDSFRDIDLVISFDAVQQMSLHARLAEPDRGVEKIQIEPLAGGTSLAPNTEATFKAKLLDADGVVIPDMAFRWSVEPLVGNGMARPQQPDTSIGIVKNAYIGFDGLTRIVPGACKVKAVVRYRGREYAGIFETVEMLP